MGHLPRARPGPTPHPLTPGWEQLLADFAVADRAAGNRPSTTRLRVEHVNRFARSVAGTPPYWVTADQLITWLGRDGWAPETRRANRGSLVRLFGWAHATGRLEGNPAAALPRVRVPVGVPRPAPDPVIGDAVRRSGPRVRLMLLLAAYQGLRRAEVAALAVEDVAGGRLHVVGKGGRHRLLPLHPSLPAELDAYQAATGITAGCWFPSPHGGHLTAQHVGRLMSRALPAGVTAHMLRHRFASEAYGSSAYDIRAVQELLGHSTPAVTARYVAAPAARLEATMLAVPAIRGIGPVRRDFPRDYPPAGQKRLAQV